LFSFSLKKKAVLENAGFQKRQYKINSLRRNYPDQVLRVCSQPVLTGTPLAELGFGSALKN